MALVKSNGRNRGANASSANNLSSRVNRLCFLVVRSSNCNDRSPHGVTGTANNRVRSDWLGEVTIICRRLKNSNLPLAAVGDSMRPIETLSVSDGIRNPGNFDEVPISACEISDGRIGLDENSLRKSVAFGNWDLVSLSISSAFKGLKRGIDKVVAVCIVLSSASGAIGAAGAPVFTGVVSLATPNKDSSATGCSMEEEMVKDSAVDGALTTD